MCFVGMMEATSGHVSVEGLDSRANIGHVRKMIGFCPQYGEAAASTNEKHMRNALSLQIFSTMNCPWTSI